jgi:Berberine and berberine like
MSTSIAFLRRPPLPTVPGPLRERFVIQVRFSSLLPQRQAKRAPMRLMAPTLMDTMTQLRYAEAGSLFMEPPLPAPWVSRSTVLQDFPSQAADALLAVLGPDSHAQLRFVELRLLGGALQRQPAVPNAVPGRSARWSLVGSGGGRSDLAPVFEEQLTTMVEALAPWAQDEMMPNFLGAQQGCTADELRAIYGCERYDRLASIKARYDPHSLFCMNHNITPT